NLERVYSFYKEVFKREGLENDVDSKTIPVFANISKYIKGNNSYSDFTNNAGICGTSIIFVGTAASGKTTKSQYLDVMGHEFTHGVIFDEVKLYAKGTSHEFDAMNEGLADIFGEFAEDYLDDKKLNNTCNWVHGEERSFIKPEKKQKMVVSDYNNDDDVHYGTYIMAHPVYLMNNGIDGDNDKKISNEKLAYMYYDAIAKMWAYNGFSDFRKIIEGLMYLPGENGDKYSLTEKQKECIIDAMDSVGIERDYDYSLTPNAELNIYDINDNPCENVEVSIFTPSGLARAENDKVKDGVYKLNNINPGIYRIVVYDENGDNKSYSAVINDNEDDPVIKYSDNDSIYTQFGGVTGNIELVLDVSDSMYGKPIECLKESALNFANVLYALAPFAKVDLIVYSTDAELVLTDITSEEELGREIKMIQTGGSTNMYDGLELTGKQLEGKKDSVIVVMSDGMPCEGECIDDDYNTPVINLAEKIKKRGAKIYSFGFFHNIAGEELKEGQELMESIASDKNSFSVTDINSSHLSGVFTSIAEQISHPGDNIHIEVHCPVDVEVSLNGKVLISSKDGILGSGEQCLLTFSGEDNEEKILNLKKGPDYKICITGYDKGTMDYSIAYTDENGDYIDERKFKDIEITDETLITTDASETKETELKVDENGDGNYDRIYRAKENSKAKEKFNILGYTKWIYALAYVIFLIISMVVGLKNGIKNKINDGVCRGCGEKNPKGALFCSSCGMKMINAKRGKKTTGAKVSF
ncbi:MAG: VWA domain-containing protein, partial [Lachnospiraceae bacterium]|nr:VWA domain-containing protein [Lachnospiraceae bacterium]